MRSSVNKKEYLLTCLSEECSEIQKEVSKAQIFGLFDINPETNISNQKAIENEINDLLGVVELLIENLYLSNDYLSTKKIKNKITKIKKWMEYSKKQGTLEIL